MRMPSNPLDKRSESETTPLMKDITLDEALALFLDGKLDSQTACLTIACQEARENREKSKCVIELEHEIEHI